MARRVFNPVLRSSHTENWIVLLQLQLVTLFELLAILIELLIFPALRLVPLPPPLVTLEIVVRAGVPYPGPALSIVAAGSAPAFWLVHKFAGSADQR
jgi:hypothetical protein